MAVFTLIEPLARICWHGFSFDMATLWAGQSGLEDDSAHLEAPTVEG